MAKGRDCSGSSRESFASFDRGSSCWRTSQRSSVEELETFSARWPRSGMMRNGRACEHPTWVPCTDAIGGSASRGSRPEWPTATVQNAHNSGTSPSQARRHALGLTEAVHRWPTATVGDSRSSGSRNTPDSKAHAVTSLTDAVRGDGGRGRTWPTPDAALFNDGQTIEAWKARNERERAKGYNGNGGGVPLAMRARLEEPTRPALRLNPAWVECLMGFPPDWTLLPPEPISTRGSLRGSSKARPIERPASARLETQSSRKSPRSLGEGS